MNELEKFLENRVKEDYGRFMLHLKSDEVEKFITLIADDDMLLIKSEVSINRVHFEIKQVISSLDDSIWLNSELLKMCDSDDRRKEYTEQIAKYQNSIDILESICNKYVQ